MLFSKEYENLEKFAAPPTKPSWILTSYNTKTNSRLILGSTKQNTKLLIKTYNNLKKIKWVFNKPAGEKNPMNFKVIQKEISKEMIYLVESAEFKSGCF